MSNFLAQLALTLCFAADVPAPPFKPLVDRYGDALPAGAIGRLGTVRFRTKGKVFDLAVAPDGKTLATIGLEEHALWEVATGKKLGIIEKAVLIGFAGDGRSLLTVSEQGVLRYREIASGKLTHRHLLVNDPTRFGKGYQWGVHLTPDGKLLAFLDPAQRAVAVWDVAAHQEVKRLALSPAQTDPIAIASDGKTLALQGAGIEILDVDTGKVVQTLKCDAARMRFSPDGKDLITSGMHQRTRSWDLRTGKERADYGAIRFLMESSALSADGKLLATVHDSLDGLSVRLWDFATGKERRSWPMKESSFLAVRFAPSGATLITAGDAGFIRFWDVASGKDLGEFVGPDQAPGRLVSSGDGRWLASWDPGERVLLWNISARVPAAQLSVTSPDAIFAFSPDSRHFAYVHKDRSVRICDVATGKPVRELAADRAAVSNLAFDLPGETLTVLYEDMTVRTWRVKEGAASRPAKLELPGSVSLFRTRYRFFSRDAQVLLVMSADESLPPSPEAYRAWDTRTGKPLMPVSALTGDLTMYRALAPDGRTFAASTLGATITIRETVTGLERLVLQVPDSNREHWFRGPLAYSPDGRLFAARNPRDQSIGLWDLATGRHVHRIDCAQAGTFALTFVGAGDVLATGGDDTTILLWDLRGVRRKLTPLAGPRSLEDMNALWRKLASDDVNDAIWKFVAGGDASVDFLRAQLRPVNGPSSKEIAEWARQLDDNAFVVRELAAKRLDRWAELSEPALRDALAKDPPLEVRRRLEHLLAKGAARSPIEPRAMRALEVLEKVGTPAATDLVTELSRGTPGAWLTREAESTLHRLRHRP